MVQSIVISVPSTALLPRSCALADREPLVLCHLTRAPSATDSGEDAEQQQQHQQQPGCGFGSRLAGGVDSAYLPSATPDPFSAAFNRDHSSPVDSPAYPCGSSDLIMKTKSPLAEESQDPSSAAHVATFSVEKSLFQLSIMVSDTNNGAATKTDSSEYSRKENRDSQFASMQSRDPGIPNSTNTGNASDFSGISDVSEFDLESFLRDFPKSKPITCNSDRVPVKDYVSRIDDLSRSSLQMAEPYPKLAPDPAPKPTAGSSVNTAKADQSQDTSKNASKKEDEGVNHDVKTEAGVLDEDDYHFNSQLASRLKSSIQSEFLSKELFPCAKQESRARTLNEIMRDYGINAPSGGTAFSAQAYQSNQFVSSTNVSSNNDGARTSSMNLDSFRFSRPEVGQGGAALQKLEPPNGASSYQFSNDVGKSLTSDLPPASGLQMKPVNFSQNNETDAPPQKQDELRSFGTSVDVSSGNAHTMAPKYQSGTRSSNSYNISSDKPLAFSGDISYPASTDFKKFNGQAPQAGAASYSGKYSASDLGKQKEFSRTDDGATTHGRGGELGGSFSPSRSNNFRLYNQMGAADALGFSLQAEKQRLRNIDAMISTTPIHSRYNDMKPYKFTTSHSFVASDFDSRRRYSTPSLGTSTYPYRAEISSRMEWSTGGAPSVMGKSVSAPTYEYSRNITTTGSSVDAQYFPTSARDTGSGRNYQYNNCTYMDKSMMDKKVNIKDAAALNKKKMEGSYRPAAKASAPHICRGSPTRSAVVRPNSATSAKVYKDSGVAKRKQNGVASAPRACVGGRKKANTNESRINDDLMAGYDFVRDLNKMWQQSIHSLEPKKLHPAKTQKYLPYKPATMEEIKNQDRSGASSEHGAAWNHKPQPKNKNSWSAAFEPSNSPMLDIEAAMCKWGSPATYGHQHKTTPAASTKQKTAALTKSYTAAATCQPPKSILKNMGNKSALTHSSTTITPARTSVRMTSTSSKNYPVTTAQMFAGLAFKKKSQASTGSRSKSAKVRSKTPLL
ncbi:hypothetical protein Btru_015003 [Bulinus truncatus]|nr:hypothetical protein Btru_015003 [Bulinus truncatus]